jgi:2-hydroxycyclohexanecarboxyl-CoA dehydrogenase
MTLTGKTAIVTGGASGIGRACAIALARRGARVAVLDINEAGTRETVQSIQGAGGDAVALRCDITDEGQVERAVSEVVTRFGRIDVLVNNAGKGGGGSFHELPRPQIDQQIAVNLTGHLLVSQRVLRQMVAQGGGRIVNIASEAATSGVDRAAVYSAAKGGIVSFTKSLAKEYAPHKITANCICPGPVDSPLFQAFVQRDPERARRYIDRIPMKRAGTPEEVAAAVTFLASDAASYITGIVLGVDGGFAMAP